MFNPLEFAGIGRRQVQRRPRHGVTNGSETTPRKCCANQSTAALKSRCCNCMTRSIAPPPPWPQCQFMNLGPLTDSTPCGVCHLRGSWGSRRAPHRGSTVSKAIPRSRWACWPRCQWSRGGIGLRMADARATLHIDDVAVFGEPVNEGGGQMGVFEEGTPSAKPRLEVMSVDFFFAAGA